MVWTVEKNELSQRCIGTGIMFHDLLAITIISTVSIFLLDKLQLKRSVLSLIDVLSNFRKVPCVLKKSDTHAEIWCQRFMLKLLISSLITTGAILVVLSPFLIAIVVSNHLLNVIFSFQAQLLIITLVVVYFSIKNLTSKKNDR